MRSRSEGLSSRLATLVLAATIVSLPVAVFAWDYPLPGYSPGSYGGRTFMCCSPAHLGEDVAAAEGTAVRAIGPGVIRDYQAAAGYGELVVVVQHDLGAPVAFTNGNGATISTRFLLSIYGHLRASQVRGGAGTGLGVGSPVTETTVIGYVNDDAHNGDGAEHLHLGIRLSDEATAKARDGGYWRRGYNSNEGTACGSDCDADFAAASQVLEILRGVGSSLAFAPDGQTVYHLQNGRRYHVTSVGLVQAMQAGGVPGWVWPPTRQLTSAQLASYREGPEFLLPDRRSDGLLVRESNTSTVYLLQNGRKRPFRSEGALNWKGRNWFPDVIDVAPGLLGDAAYVTGTGNPIEELGASLRTAYDANAADPNCTAPPEWKGWPLDPTYPSTFSRCLEFPIEGMGGTASAVSGITGSYQNMGAESGVGCGPAKGAIEQTTLGTYSVHGAIYCKWRELGYASSALGFPTGNEFSWNGSRRSNFEGGYVYWSPSTNTTYVVYNPSACTSFSISPSSVSPSSSAGSQAVTIIGSPSGCTGGSWSAFGNGSWLTVSPSSGTGSASVTVYWSQNTGAQRSGYATVAGKTFAVTQAAAAAATCSSFSISPSAASPSSSAGSQPVAVIGAPSGCSGGSWTASGNGSWLTVSPTSGSGPGAATVSWGQNIGSPRTGFATVAGNTLTVTQAAAGSSGSGTGLIGCYYNTKALSGLTMSRLDPVVDFDWGGANPAAGLGSDLFSVRWMGELEAVYTETYTFYVYGDDGFKLYVDDRLVLDRWMDQVGEWPSASLNLVAGRRYRIRLEYYESFGGAAVRLSWSSPSTAKSRIPPSRLYPPRLGPGDLLWHNQTSGDLYVWALGGVVTVGANYTAPFRIADTLWQIRGLADMNGDGETDVLWHHQGTGDLYVWYMHGAATYSGSYLTPRSLADTRWRIRGVADFNGDAKPDLLWHHQTTGDLYVWHMNGTVRTGGSYLTPKSFTDTRWQIGGLADFNRDGRTDILWHHQGNGELYVWYLNGTVRIAGAYLTPRACADTQWKISRVADFNGDGKSDVLWHHQLTGDLYVWFLDGTVTIGGSYLTPRSFANTAWKIVPR